MRRRHKRHIYSINTHWGARSALQSDTLTAPVECPGDEKLQHTLYSHPERLPNNPSQRQCRTDDDDDNTLSFFTAGRLVELTTLY